MITASNFYKLSYQQQADILLADGTYLLSRLQDNYIVDLFELDDILVEVFYESNTEDLVSVMASNTQEKLKFLTNGMNLKPRLTIKNEVPAFATQSGYYA